MEKDGIPSPGSKARRPPGYLPHVGNLVQSERIHRKQKVKARGENHPSFTQPSNKRVILKLML